MRCLTPLTSFALSVLLLGSLAPRSLHAQSSLSDTELRMLSPEYEAEAARLRAGTPNQHDFNRAVLSDVLRLLATEAGLSFYSLPDDHPDGSKLITFSIKASPFQVLETLCKANGLALILDNGIWYVRPADDKELIGRSYEIRHNALEQVEKVNLDSSSSLGSGGGASGGGSGGPPSGLDMQGARETFQAKPSDIIQDIRKILDLNDEGAGGLGASPLGGAPLPGAAGPGAADPSIAATNSNELSALRKPKVIWMSDSNTLYVVATRLQHMWVEGYLAAADKPQPMIAIEVKFIETSHDPQREFGVDWTGTFGGTGTYRQVESYEVNEAVVDPATGIVTSPSTIDVTTSNQTNSTGGFRTDLSNMWEPENLSNFAKNMVAPQFGILTAQDVSLKLRALLRDEDTKTVSYPRMVTVNNREVALRAVLNQPVLSSSTSASLGTGATTASAISYLPIGTILNILPKRMDAEKVMLNIAVTLSSIVGNELIQGNSYPVATSRLYSAPVEVSSGYTVAIGGLDEAREREQETGVPFLSKIPVLGYAFKYKNKSRNHKNLMLFITPYLIDAKEGGLPDEPQSVVRQNPMKQLTKPQIDGGTGALIGGIDSIPGAVAFIKQEGEKLARTVEEGRSTTPEEKKKLSELTTAIYHLRRQVEGYEMVNPERAAELFKAKQELDTVLSRIRKCQRTLFGNKYF